MKNLFTIEDSLENKISFYHLAAFLIMLPFDRFYTELILVSFVLHSLIHCNKHRLRSLLKPQNFILSSVFLLTVIGIAWSHDKKEALNDTTRQLAIILIPFTFSLSDSGILKYRKKLLLIFAISCTLITVYLYTDAFRIIIYNHLPLKTILSPFFVNHNFSSPIGIHATYFSLYASLSLAILLFYTVQEKNKVIQWIYIFSMIILCAGLLQLASKAVMIATIFFILTGFPFVLKSRKKRIGFLVATLCISALAFFVIRKIDSFNERFVTELKDDLIQGQGNNELPEPRITRWRGIMQLIRHSPITGYGSGSEKRLLKEKYFENKLYNSYLHGLNAHNEYLSIWLKHGIIGLLVLLFTFCYGFAAAYKKRDVILFAFMVLVATVSFSENILDVNKGVFFYAFFFAFLLFPGKPFSYLSRLDKVNT